MTAKAIHAPRIIVAGQLQGQTGDAVADHGGKAEDAEVAGELPQHDLPARHGIGEQQRHRAALHLADDGVVRQQQRDQRHEKDRRDWTG